MPKSPAKPCGSAGCRALVYDGSGRCAKHPKPVWAKAHNATKRITGRTLQKLRAELFQRNPLCVECKRQGRVSLATQRDHIKPLAEGGEDTEDNTQGLCFECHEVKSQAESKRGIHRAWSNYKDPGAGQISTPSKP